MADQEKFPKVPIGENGKPMRRVNVDEELTGTYIAKGYRLATCEEMGLPPNPLTGGLVKRGDSYLMLIEAE